MPRNLYTRFYSFSFSTQIGKSRNLWEKKTEVELELLTDFDMLQMVGQDIRGVIFHAMHRYAKSNNKYMKDYDPNTGSSYLFTGMLTIYTDGQYHKGKKR